MSQYYSHEKAVQEENDKFIAKMDRLILENPDYASKEATEEAELSVKIREIKLLGKECYCELMHKAAELRALWWRPTLRYEPEWPRIQTGIKKTNCMFCLDQMGWEFVELEHIFFDRDHQV